MAKNWSQETIDKVWAKNNNGRDWFGTHIDKSLHGHEKSGGWEIDHIYPEAEGGTDDLANLQPLYWKNNRDKGDQLSGTVNGKYFRVIQVDNGIGKMSG